MKKNNGQLEVDEQWQSTKAQNSTAEVFLHNYYTFESVHDGDHDGVVRIVIVLSCEL